MAISPKVSIRKIGKAIGGLGRRKCNRTKVGKDCPDHSRGLDAISEIETLEDSCSFRVEDYLQESTIVGKSKATPPPPAKEGTECPPWSSPKLRRKTLSPEDEAKFSPWSSPQLRRKLMVKADSWLFLSSARGCSSDNNSDSNSDRDSEDECEPIELNDVVAPLPPKNAPSKTRLQGDRRASLQRDNSWLNMMVESDCKSQQIVERLNAQTKSREKFVATHAA